MTTAGPPEAVLWRRADEVLWREGLDEVYLLAPGAGQPVTLTGPAALAWVLLEQPLSVPTLAAGLAGAYDVDVERAAEDIAPLLEDLRDRGALTCSI